MRRAAGFLAALVLAAIVLPVGALADTVAAPAGTVAGPAGQTPDVSQATVTGTITVDATDCSNVTISWTVTWDGFKPARLPSADTSAITLMAGTSGGSAFVASAGYPFSSGDTIDKSSPMVASHGTIRGTFTRNSGGWEFGPGSPLSYRILIEFGYPQIVGNSNEVPVPVACTQAQA